MCGTIKEAILTSCLELSHKESTQPEKLVSGCRRWRSRRWPRGRIRKWCSRSGCTRPREDLCRMSGSNRYISSLSIYFSKIVDFGLTRKLKYMKRTNIWSSSKHAINNLVLRASHHCCFYTFVLHLIKYLRKAVKVEEQN